MALIEAIMRGAMSLRAEVNGAPAPWDDYWYQPLGSPSSSGMRVNAESAKRIAVVMACVNVLGRTTAMLPIKMYKLSPNGHRRKVNFHPLSDVLAKRPNQQQTAFEFWQMLRWHIELRGNAYAEIREGKRGTVDQLIPMHPDKVRVERIRPSGRLRYVYDDPLTGTTRRLLGAPNAEVFHLRNNMDDMVVGQSTVAMGSDVLGLALARQDYSARFTRNDSRPPAVFTGAKFKSATDEERFLASWKANHGGAARGRIGVLPPGMDIKELGVKPVDAQLLDLMKLSDMQIISMFGVPPHLVGMGDKSATYASVEQFNLLYQIYSIFPRAVCVEQAIQRDLITNDSFYAKQDLDELMRADTKTRYEAYNLALGSGLYSQDELREKDDANPIPGGLGQNYWRSAQWMPLAQSGVAAQSSTAAVPGPEDTPESEARVRLRLMVESAADRCTRKEIATLRRMAAREFTDYDVESFYDEHAEFIAEVLRLDEQAKIEMLDVMFARAGAFLKAHRSGGESAALAYADQLAAHGNQEIAAIAVKGAR
jgi:HK97 family phage portal protein